MCVSDPSTKQTFDLPDTHPGISPLWSPLVTPSRAPLTEHVLPAHPSLECLSHLLCLANSHHHPPAQDPSFVKLPFIILSPWFSPHSIHCQQSILSTPERQGPD